MKSLKEMSRRDYGKSTITGILGGGIAAMSEYPIIEAFGGIITLLGVILGIVWLFWKPRI